MYCYVAASRLRCNQQPLFLLVYLFTRVTLGDSRYIDSHATSIKNKIQQSMSLEFTRICPLRPIIICKYHAVYGDADYIRIPYNNEKNIDISLGDSVIPGIVNAYLYEGGNASMDRILSERNKEWAAYLSGATLRWVLYPAKQKHATVFAANESSIDFRKFFAIGSGGLVNAFTSVGDLDRTVRGLSIAISGYYFFELISPFTMNIPKVSFDLNWATTLLDNEFYPVELDRDAAYWDGRCLTFIAKYVRELFTSSVCQGSATLSESLILPENRITVAKVLTQMTVVMAVSAMTKAIYSPLSFSTFKQNTNFANESAISDDFIMRRFDVFAKQMHSGLKALVNEDFESYSKNHNVPAMKAMFRPPYFEMRDETLEMYVSLSVDSDLFVKMYTNGQINDDVLSTTIHNFFDESNFTEWKSYSNATLKFSPHTLEVTAKDVHTIVASTDDVHGGCISNYRSCGLSELLSDEFIVCYVFSARVRNITPIMTMYILSSQSGSATDLCNFIKKDNAPMVPDICWHQPGVDRPMLARNACANIYDVKWDVTSAEIAGVLSYTSRDADNVKICGCANADLSPPLAPSRNPVASRCFSGACNGEDYRTYYGLSVSTCRSYCSVVHEWVNERDLKKRGDELRDFDWIRYKSICGDSLKLAAADPTADPSFRKDATWACTILALVLGVAGALQVRRYRLSKERKALHVVLIIVCVVAAALAISCIFILPGENWCQGNGTYPAKSICRSKLLKIRTFEEMCTRRMACDCVSKETCGTTGHCGQDQLCLSEYWEREVIDNPTRYRVNWFVLIMAGAIATATVLAACSLISGPRRGKVLSFLLVPVVAVVLGFFLLSTVSSSAYGPFSDSFRSPFPDSATFVNGSVKTVIPLKCVRYRPGTNEIHETPPDCLAYMDIVNLLKGGENEHFLSEAEFQCGIYMSNRKMETVNILLYAPINQLADGSNVLHMGVTNNIKTSTWGTVDIYLPAAPCDVKTEYMA